MQPLEYEWDGPAGASETEIAAARGLLSTALTFDTCQKEAIEAIASLPEGVWPDRATALVAGALRGIQQAGQTVDVIGVAQALERTAPEEVPPYATVAAMVNAAYSYNVSRDARYLRETGARRVYARKARQAIGALSQLGPEEARHFMADLGLFEVLTKSKAPLRPANVLAAPPPPPPIFEHGMEAGALGVLASEAGVAKTWIALSLGLSLATGREVFRSFRPLQPGKVLYLSFEERAHHVRYRLGEIAQAARIPRHTAEAALESGAFQFYEMEGPLFRSSGTGGPPTPTETFAGLEEAMKRERPTLVVVDPLSGAWMLRNESDNAEVHECARRLADLAESCGAAVLALHHVNKSGRGTFELASLRGASSLGARARWAMQLRRAENGVEARIVKHNHGLIPEPVHLRRLDGGALTEDEAAVTVKDYEALAAAISEWIQVHPDERLTLPNLRLGRPGGFFTDLARAHAWASREDIQRTIREMMDEGRLCECERRGRDGYLSKALLANDLQENGLPLL